MDMPLEASLPRAESESTSRPLIVSLEFAAYFALAALALALRFAELDSTPLFASETHNALAAWRVIMPNAPGEPLISTSPLLFTLQSLSFTLFGSGELTARLATALGGVALVLVPLLFRPLLGRARSFSISLLLCFSPVLLLASRSSSADVWALLLASLGLWAYWRAGELGSRYAVLAVVMFAALVFLVGASGVGLALILAVAGLAASQWRRTMLTEGEGSTASGSLVVVRRSLGTALPIAALVVLAVGTGFMLFPAGLSSVGEGLAGALQAVLQPSGAGGYAALVALFYEPVLWLLAAASLIVRRDRLTPLDVFLAAWVIVGALVTLIFADGSPDHALWLILPLVVLAGNALVSIFTPDDRIGLITPPSGSRWVIASSLIGILCVFSVSFQSVARSTIQAPQPALTMLAPPPDSTILVLVSILFLVIGYFLFASLWGSRAAWQGFGLGLALFGAVTSLGAGWNAAVTNAENPLVYWHTQATNDDTHLLRTTLFEVADRMSGGWPEMPLTVIAPPDGEIAWLLRDFVKTRYVANLSDAQAVEVVLLPGNFDQPQLGAAYVGQDFIIRRTWTTLDMNVIDFPGWWTQLQARSPQIVDDIYVLWLRQDVYQGTDGTVAAG